MLQCSPVHAWTFTDLMIGLIAIKHATTRPFLGRASSVGPWSLLRTVAIVLIIHSPRCYLCMPLVYFYQ